MGLGRRLLRPSPSRCVHQGEGRTNDHEAFTPFPIRKGLDNEPQRHGGDRNHPLNRERAPTLLRHHVVTGASP